MSLFWIVIRQLAEIEAMATSKKVITREEWEKRLSDVKIRKEDMNRLVMNFLVTEGYVEAAEKFRMESGTDPDIDLATITDRMAVKKAVQAGNVEDAIEKVNDLNPEVCMLFFPVLNAFCPYYSEPNSSSSFDHIWVEQVSLS
nr:protein GID8 homolog [Nicotiana tomentosiformis]